MSARYANVLLDFNMESISNELHALIGDTDVYNEKNGCSPPKFEFHYLRSAIETAPLLPNAVNNPKLEHSGNYDGTNYRKLQKSFHMQDFFNKHKSSADTVIHIGLGSDGKERNVVLRLFDLFHELHYNMNEVLPCTYAMFSKHNICLMPPVRSSMPTTMNVQYQVKKASRKCVEFICDLERIINENKLYNRNMYVECEHSLRNLRKVLCQFDAYKRIELEHKHGQFITENARAHADNLNGIMWDLNESVRYSNFLVYFFDWTMSKKYHKPRIERRLQISTHQLSFIREECNNIIANECAELLFQIMHEVQDEQQLGACSISKSIVNFGEYRQLLNSSYEFFDRDPIRFVG